MMSGVSTKRRGRGRRVDGAELDEMRLAVNLPITMHRALKARAAEEGVTIRDYVLALLRKQGIG